MTKGRGGGGVEARGKIQIKNSKKTFKLGVVHSKTVTNKSYCDFIDENDTVIQYRIRVEISKNWCLIYSI